MQQTTIIILQKLSESINNGKIERKRFSITVLLHGNDYGNYYKYDGITYFVDLESKLFGVEIWKGEYLGIKIDKTLLKEVPDIIGIPAELKKIEGEGETWLVCYFSKCPLYIYAGSPEESVNRIEFLRGY